MSTLGPAIVSGLFVGSLYGLLGLTVVVLFRTTGVGNFAAGSLSMFSTFLGALVFRRDLGLGIWPSFVVGLAAAGLLGAAVFYLVIRPRYQFGPLNLTFRLFGLSLLLTEIATRLWGASQPYQIRGFFTSGSVKIFDFYVDYNKILSFSVAVVAAILMFVFFERTRTGKDMRAVASDREAASLIGINVPRVELTAWVICGSLAFIVGTLFVPVTSLSSGFMDTFLIQAFAAATIGGLYSFAGAIVCGLLLGVTQTVVSLYVSYAEIQPLIALGAVLAVLLVRPAGLFGTAEVERA